MKALFPLHGHVQNKELTLQSEEEIVSEQKIMLELLADDMDCIYMSILS